MVAASMPITPYFQASKLMSRPMTTFESIHSKLLTHPAPLLPPQRPVSKSLTSSISALQLHPTLEAALHILNHDLPSAHFLARHMQSPPAYEGMYLHGILHRVEGDYDNARAWYSDVQVSDVYGRVWGKGSGMTWKQWKEAGEEETEELDEGQKFLNNVQAFKESRTADGNRKDLEQESRRELEGVIEWCVQKFGTNRMEDASQAWVNPSSEIREMGQDQVTGASGRRSF